MESASIAEQKRAHMERLQSQSFDMLEDVVDVVEADDDSASRRTGSSHHSIFRKSVAFVVGSDILGNGVVDSRRVTKQEHVNNLQK